MARQRIEIERGLLVKARDEVLKKQKPTYASDLFRAVADITGYGIGAVRARM